MKLLKKIKRNRRCFGWPGAALAVRELGTSAPMVVRVPSPHTGHPISLRLNTTGIPIYNQIFVHREYDFPVAAQPAVIVDAGTNIGLSAIYFARRFPHATIFALEPERSNFDLLVENTARYNNVVAINKALWKEPTTLDLFDPGPGRAGLQKDGFQTFTHDERAPNGVPAGKVAAIDIEQLMREHGLVHIDILKIDVEGAEREIFQHSQDWIDRVGIIAVELHDRLRPGCSRAFYNATNRFEMEMHKGENVIVAHTGLLTVPTS